MLIRFSVENFLSFKDRVIFSMYPSKGTLKKNHLNKSLKKISTLKFTSVFGANASGKSNLIKAIHFGQKVVLQDQLKNLLNELPKFKLDKSCLDKNVRFEYEIQTKKSNFAFGFVLNENIVVEEWLYCIDNKEEKLIFEKKLDRFIFSEDFLDKFDDSKYLNIISNSTPSDNLFLSYINKINLDENNKIHFSDFLDVFDWFKNALNIIYPNSKSTGFLFELTKSVDFRTLFITFLEYFDTGICGIDFKKVNFESLEIPEHLKNKILGDLNDKSSEKQAGMISDPNNNSIIFLEKGDDKKIVSSKLITQRKDISGSNTSFDIATEESDGTKRLFDLIPLFIDVIDGGNVIIIDEMERSLHPNLIYNFIELYIHVTSSKEKQVSSQLIMATHESSLLTQKLLRKDEIWFVSKSNTGSSSIHSLQEYNVRFDKELRNNYLKGRFNGVPNLGEIEDLNF
ncbi:hypothetical protein BEN71_01875 [Acinetobacter wuhouensis]|uniref:AAA family ATPase n=1 Tax=Acinetobacter wuhouensis TaxID=1879050 RepID=UPI00083B7905|nr:ATP-binding protein [Acinetobacter wuhouensis]AXQ20918.1 hypothetical protein BEN71_01875 [Acinetobacter wuhouensis]